MMTYLVIGLCLFLLAIVVYISAKPISMGIEARRNVKDTDENSNEKNQELSEYSDNKNNSEKSISDEIIKLNNLKKKGLLSDEEYQKAKDKILN
tara:strand:+ start:1656 stop:1937 length:282 start_codon:yes stop_codon:yes gene_type:complete